MHVNQIQMKGVTRLYREYLLFHYKAFFICEHQFFLNNTKILLYIICIVHILNCFLNTDLLTYYIAYTRNGFIL